MFERGGKCRVRFKVDLGYFAGGDGKLVQAQTDWMEVTVEDPPSKEARALAKIMTMPNRAWLFEPDEMPSRNSIVALRDWEANLAKFVRDNPKSYWAPHGHVALAHVYEAWARQNSLSPALEAQWISKARRSVELGLGTRKPLSACQARAQLLSRESKDTQTKPEESSAQNVSPNPVMVVFKELEGKWYDMRGLRTNRAPWRIEMARRTTEFHERWAQGEMSQAEAWRREAELIKEYVVKHQKPLSKSEWKRRYKIYVEQDAAREARSRAIQMKNAPENSRILKEHIAKRQQEKRK
jgi:hypothetical protein